MSAASPSPTMESTKVGAPPKAARPPFFCGSGDTANKAETYGYAYPPTSLSVERVRTCHQPASPSAIHLPPLNSLSSSASQPASTPNLVAASLQARRLAYYLVRTPPGNFAMGCHRLPQPATGCPTFWPLHPFKPR